jgi:hypothetical protein
MVYNQTIKNTMIEKNIKIIIMKGYEKKHSPIYIYIYIYKAMISLQKLKFQRNPKNNSSYFVFNLFKWIKM